MDIFNEFHYDVHIAIFIQEIEYTRWIYDPSYKVDEIKRDENMMLKTFTEIKQDLQDMYKIDFDGK